MKERVPPRQMGSIAISEGQRLERISTLIEKESPSARQPKEREIGTRPSKMAHGPLVVMYPVSLHTKV